MSVPRESGGAGPVVLNTRPREQAAELSERLRQAGYTPLEAPAIETVAAWDPQELSQVVQRLRANGYAWAVFASRNAVRFLLEGLQAAGGSAADLRGVQLVSGSGTAEALRAAGLDTSHTLERFSAEAALSFLDSTLGPGERVLVPRAAEGRDELLTGLASRADAPICYRTQAVAPSVMAERLGTTPVAAVILTSPSAVSSLVGHLADGPAIVCLGDTTAQAARAAGLRVDRVAERTDLSSLVEAVTAALATAATSTAERGTPNTAEVPA